ncbi:MAG: methylmalonyl-CoA mutase family protein [Bacteroidota bacterium]|nr:methylmalonyl-CoA mutase family protein [Bacteroidota bacterium]
MDQDSKRNEKLFTDFPPVSTGAWKEKIVKDLKGADYERKLVWKTREGFDVQPFYRAEDLKDLDNSDVFPGDFPFVRSNKKCSNDWLVRQELKVEDIKKTNKKALDILMKGITSLGFKLPDNQPSERDIEELLENIFADIVELNYMTKAHHLEVVKIINSLLRKYKRELEKIKGSVDYDPINYLLLHGKFLNNEKESFEAISDLLEEAKHLPNFKLLNVHATTYKNAGASLVEELAFALAHGNEYLKRTTEEGHSINEIAPRIKFNFGVGSNYFMEIAKIRAARMLWAHIVNAYGPEHPDVTKMFLHAETTDWNKTLYDNYVNMLRTTTEAMSASIAGVDSLTVKGFNSIYEDTTDFSERIARNQQLILKEESYFDKVVDPAAGSYYIENLTKSIADEAWKIFLAIDEKGGYLQSLKDGFVQERIKQSVQEKEMAIATRKISILGTNQYPGYDEKIENEMDEAFFEALDLTEQDAIIESLKPYRASQSFEKTRYATDKFAMENKRPSVFLLTYGNLAMRRARAQFSGNFFACAGFQIIDNNGFKTAEEGVKAAKDANADIIVLCSSDEEYEQVAPAAKKLIGNDAILVVAGYPKNILDTLKAKGIENFIHIKSDVLETLSKFQKQLKII